LHSLLIAHPQILITPPFSFYRSWNQIIRNKEIDNSRIIDSWLDFIFYHKTMQRDYKRFFSSEDEKQKFEEYFKLISKNEVITKKFIFYNLHEAYAHAKGITINDIKLIVCQEHVPWHTDDILSDFPLASILQIVRDPRATLAGSWKLNSKRDGYLSENDYLWSLLYWITAWKNYEKFSIKIGNRYKIVKNEDLHLNLKINIKDICTWLNIDFNEIMIKEELKGNSYKESAYLDEKGNYPQSVNIFYQPENIEKRWKKVLSNNDIYRIEFITYQAIKRFNYINYSKQGLLYKIFGFFLYLFLRKDQIVGILKNKDIEKIDLSLKDFKNKLRKIYIFLPSFIRLVIVFIFSFARRLWYLLFKNNKSKFLA